MHRLAVADERLDALGHHGLGLDRAALRPHPHPVTLGDALFLRQLFRDFHEEFRLQNGIHRDVLRPVVEMLGQAVGSRRIGNSSEAVSANCLKSSLKTRATGLPRTFGAITLATGDSNGS